MFAFLSTALMHIHTIFSTYTFSENCWCSRAVPTRRGIPKPKKIKIKKKYHELLWSDTGRRDSWLSTAVYLPVMIIENRTYRKY